MSRSSCHIQIFGMASTLPGQSHAAPRHAHYNIYCMPINTCTALCIYGWRVPSGGDPDSVGSRMGAAGPRHGTPKWLMLHPDPAFRWEEHDAAHATTMQFEERHKVNALTLHRLLRDFVPSTRRCRIFGGRKHHPNV